MFLPLYFYTQAKLTHCLINTETQIHTLMVVSPVSLLSCSCVYVHAAK